MKRNLILIAGIFLFTIIIILAGNIIIIGEKISSITNLWYLEYLFYGIIAGILFYTIILPIIRVHNAPEFPVLSVDERHNADELYAFGIKLLNSCNDSNRRDNLRKKLHLHCAESKKLRNLIQEELTVRIENLNSRIKEWGKTVFMITAISQNSKFDTLTVLIMNYRMIEDIIVSTGFRPTKKQLFYQYVRILTTALVSYCTSEVFHDVDGVAPFDITDEKRKIVNTIEDIDDTNSNDMIDMSVDFDNQNGDFLYSLLRNIKIPGWLLGSAFDGAINALLTLRIGYVTRAYLLQGPQSLSGTKNKRLTKRQAIKDSFKTLPGIVMDASTIIGSNTANFVLKILHKQSSSINMENV